MCVYIPYHPSYITLNIRKQWRKQVLKKEWAPLHTIFKLTDFGLSFTLSKVKFVGKKGGYAPPHLPSTGKRALSETLYHRDDALLYIAYVMLIWAAPIPADRWHCSLWP